MRVSDRFWKDVAVVLGLSSTFVCAAVYLNRHGPNLAVVTPTFFVLSPGFLCASIASNPFSTFDASPPWGPIAVLIYWMVNIGFCGGLAYLVIFLRRHRKAS
jgi:drug/metabolite transporter (DMT)-like permease